MKNVLPVLALICICQTTDAVPITKRAKEQQPWQDIIQQQVSLRSANKGTALQKRLIAYSYFANGQNVDTAHYYYSNGRGSVHNGLDSYRDNYYPTSLDTRQNIFCDSSASWYYDMSNLLVKNTVKAYTYDANNKVLQVDLPYPYLYKYENSFDAQGRVIKVTSSDTFGTGTLTKRYEMYAIYDAQGNRIIDSNVTLATNQSTNKRVYAYDANGNRTLFESYQKDNNGQWYISYKGTFTYDASNRLKTSTSEYVMTQGGPLQPIARDSFDYAGNNTQPTYHASYFWNSFGMEWMPDELLTNTLNAQGQPDTMYIYTWQPGVPGAWEPTERNVYTYDAGGQLVLRSNGYMHLGGGIYNPTPYDQSSMYYEEYDPNSVSNTVSKAAHEIIVYPNPTTNTLYVSAKGLSSATVSITSMEGKILLTQSMGNSEHTEVNITSLPAGNYILSVTDGNKHTSNKQFTKL